MGDVGYIPPGVSSGTNVFTGPLTTQSGTDSTTTETGSIVQDSGAPATSVGIGLGKINVGTRVNIGSSTSTQPLSINHATLPIVEIQRGGTPVGFVANGAAVFGAGGLLDIGINANAAANLVLIGSGGVVAISANPGTTGTKIGAAAGQKVGFFNTTPVVQPSTTGETVGFVGGAGTTVHDDSTFTGNVGSTAYRLSDIVKALKNLGIIAQ